MSFGAAGYLREGNTAWSPEEIERLSVLYAEGLPYPAIAARLNAEFHPGSAARDRHKVACYVHTLRVKGALPERRFIMEPPKPVPVERKALNLPPRRGVGGGWQWGDAEEKALINYLRQGMSYLDIAALLNRAFHSGHPVRSDDAIAGKAARLRESIGTHATQARVKRAPVSAGKRWAARHVLIEASTETEETPEGAPPLRPAPEAPSGCRWIARHGPHYFGDGDPYCNAAKQPGSSYCPVHHGVVWVKHGTPGTEGAP